MGSETMPTHLHKQLPDTCSVIVFERCEVRKQLQEGALAHPVAEVGGSRLCRAAGNRATGGGGRCKIEKMQL